MSENPFSLWVYLSQSPLLWLTVTLLTYAVVDAVSLNETGMPLANPVLHSIWIIGVFLLATGTSYTTYFAARSSCTSCSARPPWRWRCRSMKTARLSRRSILPMLLALVIGSHHRDRLRGGAGADGGPAARNCPVAVIEIRHRRRRDGHRRISSTPTRR